MEARDLPSRIRQNLAVLEVLCAREGERESSACPSASATECLKVHEAFSVALGKVEARIKEAAAWWKRRGAARDDEKSITITFDLPSLPDYPYRDADSFVNDALRLSNQTLDGMSEEAAKVARIPSCRKRAQQLREFWAGEGAATSLLELHNALGEDISNLLSQSENALRSGAAQEAAAALGKLGVPVKRRKK